MKRFLGLLVLVLLLNGCDDGDLILETINFDNATTQSCSSNNILYRLNEKEALLLEIDKSIFKSEPTPTNEPIEITIGEDNRVIYRFYNGEVGSATICETIPPATPIVVDEWTTEGGTIQIYTTAIKTTNATTNATKITGYNHNIVFKDVTFLKKNGTQVYESFTFGNYETKVDLLPFSFDQTIEKCATNSPNLLYNFNSSESLTLDIDPSLLANEVTALNTPRTGLLSASNNILTYRFYSGLLNEDYFCKANLPTSPSVSQEWKAVSGVSNSSGIIEVTTTTNGTGFKHTIVLKKVTLEKGSNNFYLGDSFIYGEILTE
ncbi:MAG: hypothetical protein K9I26_03485 [Flavobacterium sp.]|nr:hypothetical protein [Flavobacterium sp.]